MRHADLPSLPIWEHDDLSGFCWVYLLSPDVCHSR
jgi:hypothetical protein